MILALALELINRAISSNHRILVFSQFASVFPILAKMLDEQGIKHLTLDGTTKAMKRMELVDEFNNNSDNKVFMVYTDPFTNEKFVPYCVEPAVGVDRIVLAVLCEAYDKEQLEKDTRTVMHLSPALAPYKVAVLPLSKQLKEEAEELLYRFVKEFPATYDETGSIGKRYRRQDSIGTPFCVTVDFDSNEQKTYTLRNRDTMEQVRLTYDEIVDYINNAIRI